MIPHTIIVDNVNEALPEALWYLKVSGVQSESRNGPVIVAPGPVITVYKNPRRRVLMSPARNANPFFHFFEALWMLAGRNDVAYLAQFNPRMAEFSDNGVDLNGAYGYRWFNRFFVDQIGEVIEHLKSDPSSRREVITMWGASDLANRSSLDVPCNTHIYVDVREGALNITVCNRSNDLWWGAYGANVVHFSFLQEFLAAAVGVEVGTYTQFSNNFHLYTKVYDGSKILESINKFEVHTAYPNFHFPIMVTVDYECWLRDVKNFVSGSAEVFVDPFFNFVASPMRSCWEAYKKGEYATAHKHCELIGAADWKIACREWLTRREENSK